MTPGKLYRSSERIAFTKGKLAKRVYVFDSSNTNVFTLPVDSIFLFCDYKQLTDNDCRIEILYMDKILTRILHIGSFEKWVNIL